MATRKRPMLVALIGSIIWWIFFTLTTVIVAPFVILFSFISFSAAYQTALLWSRFNIYSLSWFCGLHFKVEGKENIPESDRGYVMMSKHQSTWETLALSFTLPPHVWVFKKELQYIPLFGWALWSVKPIAIDRSGGQTTLDQVLLHGKNRLDKGICIMIFPEGTRVPAGTKKRYKQGGSALAVHAKTPVLPVAHNAGHFWPRGQFIKNAGIITIRIGELISSEGKTADTLNNEVEAWIEAQQEELDTDGAAQISGQ